MNRTSVRHTQSLQYKYDTQHHLLKNYIKSEILLHHLW